MNAIWNTLYNEANIAAVRRLQRTYDAAYAG